MNNRFYVQLQEGMTPEQTGQRSMQELLRLTAQLNGANLPISVGPNENLPEGILPGQPVIDWSSGTSQLKVWNGTNLI